MGGRVESNVVRRSGRRAAPYFRRGLRSAPAVGAILATILFCASSPASAVVMDPVHFDLTGDGVGSEFVFSDSASGLTLTLSARTLIPDGQDALNGQTGVVFIDALGAGVKFTLSSGSKEISGGGGHQDEALDFALSMPVVTNTVMITLTKFDLDKASKKKSKKKGDRGVVYVPPDLTMPTIGEDLFLEALMPVPGETDTFMLSFAEVLKIDPSALPESLEFFSIRATDGHFLVSSFKAVPEPSTLGLLGMGMLGVGLARTRRSRTRVDPSTLRSAHRDPSNRRH